ncbi:MAG: DUF952 domain-containing protein, partial [Pseudomonadota bacterium]
MLVYKIMTEVEFAAFRSGGTFAGSAADLADGFIHLSAADQLAGTLAKHFAGRGALVLLACESGTLGEALRWEPSRGGQDFPHLYRALTERDIVWTRPMSPD